LRRYHLFRKGRERTEVEREEKEKRKERRGRKRGIVDRVEGFSLNLAFVILFD